MQLQKIIENLGYTSREAKVYLAVLHLGESHISDVASKVKMPRSSVQIIVDKLHKEQLLNFYVMKRYKYWVAENPEHLLNNLKKREELLTQALPELIAIKHASSNKHKSLDSSTIGMFRMLADSSKQPVMITNDKAEIQYVNSVWEKQFGYDLVEVKGKNPRILKSGKTQKEVYDKMWKALKAEKIFQTDEIIDKKRNGEYCNLLTTMLPLRHQGQLFYVQILDDITEKKRVTALQNKFMNAAHA